MADSAVGPRCFSHIFLHDLQCKMHKWKRKTWSKTAGHQNGSLTIFPSATRLLFILDMACSSCICRFELFQRFWPIFGIEKVFSLLLFCNDDWQTEKRGRGRKLIEPRRQFPLWGEVPSIDSEKWVNNLSTVDGIKRSIILSKQKVIFKALNLGTRDSFLCPV